MIILLFILLIYDHTLILLQEICHWAGFHLSDWLVLMVAGERYFQAMIHLI